MTCACMDKPIKNLFAVPLGASDQENVLPLLDSPHVRIERIVSNGHWSPPDFWYDQEQNEWVLLLRGTATLKFEDGSLVHLTAGDYLLIKAHVKHRVEEVSPDAIWLAVHYGEPSKRAGGTNES